MMEEQRRTVEAQAHQWNQILSGPLLKLPDPADGAAYWETLGTAFGGAAPAPRG